MFILQLALQSAAVDYSDAITQDTIDYLVSKGYNAEDGESFQCSACISTIDVLKSLVAKYGSASLATLCVMTGPLAPVCAIIVTVGGSKLINWLLDGALSAKEICQYVKLC